MTTMKKILALLLLVPALAWSAGVKTPLERAPINPHDKASLQRGAQIFVNHCLNCHGAAAMRYGRLTDLGLTEQQIRENLLFTAEKVGESMSTALDPKVAKAAFGIVPPDLSLIARSRSADWLYTYMRSFYRDPASKTGWNNTVFPNVAMPHVLWQLQGQRRLEIVKTEEGGHHGEQQKWSEISKGTMSATEYDTTVRDLVNFLVWAGEPNALHRKPIGIVVLFVLGVLFILAYLLKKEYWKDVK